MNTVWERLSEARLYGIADLGYVASEDLECVVEDLLSGGVDLLQLRAKSHSVVAIEAMAKRILPLCREAGVPFIVNDFPSVAVSIGADGVHLGQDDGSLAEVRALLGKEMIVGRSTHSLAQAEAAKEEGFDYIGFGPLFPTPTKQGRPGIGLDDIATVEATVAGVTPVFCIGGIKPENLGEVLVAGARCVVIVSALLRAGNVREATAAVKRVLMER